MSAGGTNTSTVVELLESGARSVLVDGPNGAGRSQLLARTAEDLKQRGRLPVLVSPPERQLDTASLALLDCGIGLANHGLLQTEIATEWSDRGTWRERNDQVRHWLSGSEIDLSNVVLLCDDASQWSVPESESSARRSESVRGILIGDAHCQKVVVGNPRDVPHDARIVLDSPTGARDRLSDERRWGALAETAGALRETGILGAGHNVPTLQLGLLVAYAALASPQDLKAWWRPSMSTERVADQLAKLVAADRGLRPLWVAWVTAATLRRAAPRDWLKSVRERVQADEQRAVLDGCLLFGADEVRLAREVRSAAWRQHDDFSRRVQSKAAKDMLANYVGAFEIAAAQAQPQTLMYGAEAIYLAGRIGQSDVVDRVAPNFGDQLNAFGVTSLERKDPAAASEAFEIAIEWDADDAFAHQHLGFALDSEGNDPKRVEAEYRHSLRLDSSLATWHERLVSFLFVRARLDDAKAAWEEAIVALGTDDGEGALGLYTKLHIPVAALLLRRADLAFAREVLDDVPAWAGAQILGFEDLRRRLALLEQSELDGVFVPAHRAHADWWLRGPQLLQESDDGRPLQLWMAGRVDAKNELGVHVSVAIVEGTEQPETGTVTLTEEELLAMTPDIGRAKRLAVGWFIEFGVYTSDEAPIVRIVEPEPWAEGIQTPLDPARYLRSR